MATTRTLILDQQQTRQKIRRIAFEIYENNFQETEIILAGVYDKGYLLASLIQREIQAIAPLQITIVKVTLDKFSPRQSDVQVDCNPDSLAGKPVILVDDVLYTGRTLAYSLKPFLAVGAKKIQTAVIVDRGYRQFPVAADYVGYALSTTIQEHIEVVLEDEQPVGVYLS